MPFEFHLRRECGSVTLEFPISHPREMENISRGPTFAFGAFVTILTEGSMQNNTVARLQSTRVKTPFSPPYIKCNALRESLSVDSQNIPCATLKRWGVVGNLYISLPHPFEWYGQTCKWTTQMGRWSVGLLPTYQLSSTLVLRRMMSPSLNSSSPAFSASKSNKACNTTTA